MNRDLGVWTSQDVALVLIDYQKEQLESIRSETPADLIGTRSPGEAPPISASAIPLLRYGGPAIGEAVCEIIGEFADNAGVAASTAGIDQFDGRQLRQPQAVTNHAQWRRDERPRQYRDPQALHRGRFQALEARTDEAEMPRTLVIP